MAGENVEKSGVNLPLDNEQKKVVDAAKLRKQNQADNQPPISPSKQDVITSQVPYATTDSLLWAFQNVSKEQKMK